MKLVIVSLVFISSLCKCGQDWCDLNCDSGHKNTMCIYKPQKAIKGCKDITESQTPTGRKDMLHMHNKYRDEMASGKMSGWPKAANMMQMSWDPEVEAMALRWAQQCTPGHDKCRRTINFFYIGQNYGMEGNSAEFPSSKGSFDGWVNEISLVEDPKSMLRSFKGGRWGHFTQVVWALSFKLGCAEIHTEEGGFKKTITICNYGPGGNFVTEKMYEEGEPCTKCPKGTECRSGSTYPNLCAWPKDDTKPTDIEGSRLNTGTRSSIGFLRVISILSVNFVVFTSANS